jgi:succinylglutamate desuccinylase
MPPNSEPDSPRLEVLPRDLSAYKQGNTGIDYVHRFESARPGPHVLINALTHGNEFCGMSVITDLLDRAIRPSCGTLTLSFSNIAAYESFDQARPFESRQIVHNFNRIWDSAFLDGQEDSPELRRARILRPVFEQADHLLDFHSTSTEVEAFWVYNGRNANGALASAIGLPRVHMVMPGGLGSGTPIIQYGKLGASTDDCTGLVVECGQHFLQATSDLAIDVAHKYLSHFGMIPEARKPISIAPQKRFELLETCMVKTSSFQFTGPYKGFESFAKGALIATDGPEEIRALCDHCTILMPAREPTVGREAVYLTRPLA